MIWHNIFNLFLFLLALWISFMLVGGNLSWLYVIFGILSAAAVSFISFRFKIIESQSELLYLSLGFYRHFTKLFFGNFFSSLLLIFKLAFVPNKISPIVHSIKISQEESRFNIGLLIASINMSSGLFLIGFKGAEFFIHALDWQYLNKFNLSKICKSLNNVNDDNLV